MLERKINKLEESAKIQDLILEYAGSIGSSKHYSIADNQCPIFNDRLPILSFLRHVVRGKESLAEAMLIKSPELLFKKDCVTDYSNRKFNSISGFQYAAWAYDINMLQMMLKYISKEQKAKAYTQLEELEIKKTEHQAHYDFIPLLESLLNYVKKPDSNQWLGIGHKQSQVPTHIAQEYCQPDRNIISTQIPQSLFKDHKLKRSLKCGNSSSSQSLYKWFPLSASSALGKEFAITISRNEPPGAVQRNRYPAAVSSAGRNAFYGRFDLAFVSTLFSVRVAEYQEIKKDLQAKDNKKQKDSLSTIFGDLDLDEVSTENKKHNKIYLEISKLI